ncbi:MAG TPA: hypothetical protein VHD32_16310 [Candidatus Didemnitutus sp.]|nr:hypothetical protein [Candidatus Didemnitutus sp.]
MDTPAKVAAPRRRAESLFFAVMVVWMMVIVFIGFAHTYYLAGLFRARLPSPIVHIHAVLFTSWWLILVLQVVLIATGNRPWHIRLGSVGMAVAPAMIVSGLLTLAAAVRRHAEMDMPPEVLLEVDVLQLLGFGILILWAYLVRTNGAAHKRLVLLASAALLGPALSRWPYESITGSDWTFYLVLDSVPICLIVFDLISRRRPHSVTLLGSGILVLLQYLMSTSAHWPIWHELTAWIQRF